MISFCTNFTYQIQTFFHFIDSTHCAGSQQQRHTARTIWARKLPNSSIISTARGNSVGCCIRSHWQLPIVRVFVSFLVRLLVTCDHPAVSLLRVLQGVQFRCRFPSLSSTQCIVYQSSDSLRVLSILLSHLQFNLVCPSPAAALLLRGNACGRWLMPPARLVCQFCLILAWSLPTPLANFVVWL